MDKKTDEMLAGLSAQTVSMLIQKANLLGLDGQVVVNVEAIQMEGSDSKQITFQVLPEKKFKLLMAKMGNKKAPPLIVVPK